MSGAVNVYCFYYFYFFSQRTRRFGRKFVEKFHYYLTHFVDEIFVLLMVRRY